MTKKKKKKREEEEEARKEANSYEVDIESSMSNCQSISYFLVS